MRRNRGKGKGQQFIRMVLQNDTDECVLWPFYRMPNGYAQVGFHDGQKLAHRYVCELAHGPAPAGKPEAAHSCGNRACVNPKHLRWSNHSDNEADKRNHGTWFTRMGGAKLTENKVREIRTAAACGVPRAALVERFKTPVSTIEKVVSRRTWKHV